MKKPVYIIIGIIVIVGVLINGVLIYFNVTNKSEISNNTSKFVYVACGCGCCGGIEPIEHCLEDGDDLEQIKKDNQESQQNEECALMGCSLGIGYRYCN